MKNYAALIVDLKKSKKYSIKLRNDIQWYIMETLDVMNEIFNKALVKKVDFSAGDEVQGLFSSVEAAFLYFRMFSMLLSPIEIRAGIGMGAWDVVVENAGTTAQDGKAYHYARHAIEATEESLGYSVLLFSNSDKDLIFNSLLNSTALIINKQSEYQNEVMLLSELLYPINAYDIIDDFEIAQIIALIQKKKEFVHYDLIRMNKNNKPSLFYRISKFDIDCKPVNVFDDNCTFFVTNGKIKGLANQLASLIGVSRQSIEKTIKAANIYEARNLAITTLNYLKSEGENK